LWQKNIAIGCPPAEFEELPFYGSAPETLAVGHGDAANTQGWNGMVHRDLCRRNKRRGQILIPPMPARTFFRWEGKLLEGLVKRQKTQNRVSNSTGSSRGEFAEKVPLKT